MKRPKKFILRATKTAADLAVLLILTHIVKASTTDLISRLPIVSNPGSANPKTSLFKASVRSSYSFWNKRLSIELFYRPINANSYKSTKVLSITVPFNQSSKEYQDRYITYTPSSSNSLYRTSGDMTLSGVDPHFYVFPEDSRPVKLSSFKLRCHIYVKNDNNGNNYFLPEILNYTMNFEDSDQSEDREGGLEEGNEFMITFDSNDTEDLSYNIFLFTVMLIFGCLANFVIECFKLVKRGIFNYDFTMEWFGHYISYISYLISAFTILRFLGGFWAVLGWTFLFMLFKIGEVMLAFLFIFISLSERPSLLKYLKFVFLTKLNILSLAINITFVYLCLAVSPRFVFHGPMLLLISTALDLILTRNAYIRAWSSFGFISNLFVVNFGNQLFYYGIYYVLFVNLYDKNPITLEFFVYPYLVAYPVLWVISLFKLRINGKRLRLFGRRLQTVKKIDIGGKVDFLYSKASQRWFEGGSSRGGGYQAVLTGNQMNKVSDFVHKRIVNRDKLDADQSSILRMFTSPHSNYFYRVGRIRGYDSLLCFSSFQNCSERSVESIRKWDFRLNMLKGKLTVPIHNVWYENEKKDDFLGVVNKTDIGYRLKLLRLKSRKVVLRSEFVNMVDLASYLKPKLLDIFISPAGPVGLIYSYKNELFKIDLRKEADCLDVSASDTVESVSMQSPELITGIEDENQVKGVVEIYSEFSLLHKSKKLKLVRNTFFGDLMATFYVYVDEEFLDRDFINQAKFQNVIIYRVEKRSSSGFGGLDGGGQYEGGVDKDGKGSKRLASLDKITEGLFSSWKIDEVFFVTRNHLSLIMGDRIALVDWKRQEVLKILEIPSLFSYRTLEQSLPRRESLGRFYYASYDYKRSRGMIYFCLGRYFEDDNDKSGSDWRRFVSGLYLDRGVYDVSGVLFDGNLKEICSRAEDRSVMEDKTGAAGFEDKLFERGLYHTGMLTQSLIEPEATRLSLKNTE